MKIGIVGATGSYGEGLALQWARKHTVYIGSRSPEKAGLKAKEYQEELRRHGIEARIIGTSNLEAAANGEIVVYTVKFEHLEPLLAEAKDRLRGKIVISPVVPLKKMQAFQYAPPPEGSAAMLIQKTIPDARVVAALHVIPAERLHIIGSTLEGDVPVCGDDREAKATVIGLIREIERLNPIDAGPLEVSRLVEPLVPLLLNIKVHGLKRNASIKFL